MTNIPTHEIAALARRQLQEAAEAFGAMSFFSSDTERAVHAKSQIAASPTITALATQSLTEQERLTAVVVAAGNPASEVAMIARPPMTLGTLQSMEATLDREDATQSQRNIAAQVLIWSSHRPHRLRAAMQMMAGADNLRRA